LKLFEALAIHGFILSLSPFSCSVLALIQKMMVQTVQPGIAILWSLAAVVFVILHPITPSSKLLITLLLAPQKCQINFYF
jgi:hypothetical protein